MFRGRDFSLLHSALFVTEKGSFNASGAADRESTNQEGSAQNATDRVILSRDVNVQNVVVLETMSASTVMSWGRAGLATVPGIGRQSRVEVAMETVTGLLNHAILAMAADRQGAFGVAVKRFSRSTLNATYSST